MPIKVLESSDTKLKIELVGEDHTISNLLAKTLLEDPAVKFATYNIDHPLVSNPVLVVITDGSKSAKQALLDALSKIKSRINEFRSEFRRVIEKVAPEELKE